MARHDTNQLYHKMFDNPALCDTSRDVYTQLHARGDLFAHHTQSKNPIYDKLCNDQLAQIEKSVLAHNHCIEIVNVTPEADARLLRYGFTRTRHSERVSTYEFIVDKTAADAWAQCCIRYSVGGCIVIALLCLCTH